ncbi:hypothetical protein ACG1BZ_09315 [Microbulbifer sp. CNSA002]|uniref:hypothetical protein n=1 Tax=Microbulbifer sp. CNSA002 TaxID=3373604 RepID=UPI0039B5F0A8
MEFENLPLHDAILEEIGYSWGLKRAVLSGKLVSNVGSKFQLVFSNVLQMHVSNEESWGPSNSISDLDSDGTSYAINMQSGDQVTLHASGFTYAASTT